MSKAEKKMGIVKKKEKPLVKDVCNGPKKKKSKNKIPIDVLYHSCPFCSAVFEKIYPDKDWWYSVPLPGRNVCTMEDNWKPKCMSCGAFEVKDSCPACHRNTWFLPDDKTCTTGEYRHRKHWLGCGFSGRLKIKEKK